MLLKSQTDVNLFIKMLDNHQLYDINIKYFYNICNEIELVPKTTLSIVKHKYCEYSALLKEMHCQNRMLYAKMNVESGIDINNNALEHNNNPFQNNELDKCLEILFQYSEKINYVHKIINNICHIMSICESIIFNVWKKYYSITKSKKLKENEHFVEKFIGIFDSLINYNLFYIHL